MKKICIFLLTLTSLGCVSPQKSSFDYLAGIKKIPLGATKTQIINIFGEPNRSEMLEIDDGNLRITYTIPYKKIALDKAIFWINKNGVVSAKHITLFEEDTMNLEQTKKYFGVSDLELEPLNLKGLHYIPSERVYKNKVEGISFVANPARKNEVSDIGWYKPDAAVAAQIK